MNSTLSVLLFLTATGDAVLISVPAMTGMAAVRASARKSETIAFMIPCRFIIHLPRDRQLPAHPFSSVLSAFLTGIKMPDSFPQIHYTQKAAEIYANCADQQKNDAVLLQ